MILDCTRPLWPDVAILATMTLLFIVLIEGYARLRLRMLRRDPAWRDED